jgi:K+-sensing histidine kinase KdpD
LREIFEEAAEKTGTVLRIKGDRKTKLDRDYFRTAVFNLLDNAARYRTKDSEIEVNITPKAVVITNKTGADSFTPGYGIAIAGRIIEQHGQKLSTELKDGVFEARITGK